MSCTTPGACFTQSFVLHSDTYILITPLAHSMIISYLGAQLDCIHLSRPSFHLAPCPEHEHLNASELGPMNDFFFPISLHLQSIMEIRGERIYMKCISTYLFHESEDASILLPQSRESCVLKNCDFSVHFPPSNTT